MGKTESIKERRVDVYLDTLERKERWADIAEEHDDSLSTFVQKAVEYAIEHGGPDFVELGERSKRIRELDDQVEELRKEVKQKDIVIEKLETELRRHRSEPFLEDELEGVRKHDEDLIDILKNTDRITGAQLRERLGVDPTESEVMEGINRQLEQLEDYGLVASTANGWRWTG